MASKDEAQQAVWDGVVRVIEEAQQYGGPTGGQMLRDAALAYRLAAGGPQPGGVPMPD
jgi:hypothetical protein